MTIDSPDKYVMSLRTASTGVSASVMKDTAPPEVPEHQAGDYFPVNDEHSKSSDSHSPNPAMGFGIALSLERIHLL